MRALTWTDGVLTERPATDPAARTARQRLEEAVAELHPEVLEELGAVSEGTLRRALRELTLSGAGVVVLCGAAYGSAGSCGCRPTGYQPAA